MTKCRLCGLEKKLIKKSHIYPDFLYKDLYDENHKIIRVTSDEIKKRNPKIARPSTGIYEGNLLCFDCDNGIINSKYETYFADIIFGKNNKVKCTKINSKAKTFIKIENLDYEKIKNFFLSVLFRADICTFEEFSGINLGKFHHDKIRKIVLENLHTNDLEYQINVFKLEDNSDFREIITQPFRGKIDTETCYSFLLKEYLIIINFKENQSSKEMKENRLKEVGEILISIIPKRLEKGFFLSYLNFK